MSYWQTSGGRRLKSNQAANKKRGAAGSSLLDPTLLGSVPSQRPSQLRRGGRSEGLSFGYSAAVDPMMRRGIASGDISRPGQAPPESQQPRPLPQHSNRRMRDASHGPYMVMPRRSSNGGGAHAQQHQQQPPPMMAPIPRCQQYAAAPLNQQFMPEPPENYPMHSEHSANYDYSNGKTIYMQYPQPPLPPMNPYQPERSPGIASFRSRSPRPDSFDAQWSPNVLRKHPLSANHSSSRSSNSSSHQSNRQRTLHERNEPWPERYPLQPQQQPLDDDYLRMPPPPAVPHGSPVGPQYADFGTNHDVHYPQQHEYPLSEQHYNPSHAGLLVDYSHQHEPFIDDGGGSFSGSRGLELPVRRGHTPHLNHDRHFPQPVPAWTNDPSPPVAFGDHGDGSIKDDPFSVPDAMPLYAEQRIDENSLNFQQETPRQPMGNPYSSDIRLTGATTPFEGPVQSVFDQARDTLDSWDDDCLEQAEARPEPGEVEVLDFLFGHQETSEGIAEFKQKRRRDLEQDEERLAKPLQLAKLPETPETVVQFSTYKAPTRPPTAPARLQVQTPAEKKEKPLSPPHEQRLHRSELDSENVDPQTSIRSASQGRHQQASPKPMDGAHAAIDDISSDDSSSLEPPHPMDHNPTYEAPNWLRFYKGSTEVDIMGRPLELKGNSKTPTSKPATSTHSSPESESSSLSGLALEGKTSLWGNTPK